MDRFGSAWMRKLASVVPLVLSALLVMSAVPIVGAAVAGSSDDGGVDEFSENSIAIPSDDSTSAFTEEAGPSFVLNTFADTDLTKLISYRVAFQVFDNDVGDYIDIPSGYFFKNSLTKADYRIAVDWSLLPGVILTQGSGFRIPIIFEGSPVLFGPVDSSYVLSGADGERIGSLVFAHADENGMPTSASLETVPGTNYVIAADFTSGSLSDLNNIRGNLHLDIEFYPQQSTEQDEFRWVSNSNVVVGKAEPPFIPPTDSPGGWSDKEDFDKRMEIDGSGTIIYNVLQINEYRETFATYGDEVKLTDTLGPGLTLTPLRARSRTDGSADISTMQGVDYTRGIFGATLDDAAGAPGYFKLLSVDWERAYAMLYAVQVGQGRSSLAGYALPDPDTIRNLESKQAIQYLDYVRALVWHLANEAWGGDELSQIQGAAMLGEAGSFGYLNSSLDPAFVAWRGVHGGFSTYEDVLAYFLEPLTTEEINSISISGSGFSLNLRNEALSGRSLFVSYLTDIAVPDQASFTNGATIDWKGEPRSTTETIKNITGGGSASGDVNRLTIHKLDPDGNPVSGARFEVAIYAADDPDFKGEPLFVQDLLLEGAQASARTDYLGEYTSADFIVITEIAPPTGYLPIPGERVVMHIDPAHSYAVTSISPEPLDASNPQGATWLEVTSSPSGNIQLYLNDQLLPYDAALRKWVSAVDGVAVDVSDALAGHPSQPVETAPGSLVTFTIRVFNQCSYPLITPLISDYPPELLVWDETIADTLNPGWTWHDPAVPGAADDPHTNQLTYDWSDLEDGAPVLMPTTSTEQGVYSEGSFVDIELTLRVSTDLTDSRVLTNIAEISELANEDGDLVADIDSTPDSDSANESSMVDNEIDNADDDEDDSDFAQVWVQLGIGCEVDKDTIRRTSAAYVSLPGQEGFDNVGREDERFRYDIDFRSTSNVPAEEFIVDDPLENIGTLDQVRLQELWTPATWGDLDGVYNVWYQTNLTDPRYDYEPGVTLSPHPATPAFPNTGYRLWVHYNDSSFWSEVDTYRTYRHHLTVADLDLREGEYITALRFEYGSVAVGFTSKNYSDLSLNGEHRASDGSVALPSINAGALRLLVNEVSQDRLALQGDLVSQSGATPQSGITAQAGGITVDGELDWTPNPTRSDYALGACEATGLRPASYLVSAAREMTDEDIVSSASARIALGEMRDTDFDAVLTREIATFRQSGADPLPLFGLTTSASEVSTGAGAGHDGRSALPITGDALAGMVVGIVALVGTLVAAIMCRLRGRMRVFSARRLRLLFGGGVRADLSTQRSTAGAHRVVIVLAVAAIAGLLLTVPGALSNAFATTSDPVAVRGQDDRLAIEYRYLDSAVPTIPEYITQFGRDYRLVAQEVPVLEGSLPLTRTYEYRVYGALPAERLAEAEGLPDVSIASVDVVHKVPVDRTEVITDLPTNDVELLPTSKIFAVSSASPAGGTVSLALQRAGVSYEVTSYEDEEGRLPATYAATVVYRGMESYEDFGYYRVESIYHTDEAVGEADSWVIVAWYEPVDDADANGLAELADPAIPLGASADEAGKADGEDEQSDGTSSGSRDPQDLDETTTPLSAPLSARQQVFVFDTLPFVALAFLSLAIILFVTVLIRRHLRRAR
ncbi:MAG: hypothetical protein LBI64_03795 [Coriobacteriales bacterium]|nr:hypothetical protein [Coriobacteriales bacterium]